MKRNLPQRIQTIDEYHRLFGHSSPRHPLVSVIDLATITAIPDVNTSALVYDFYCIVLKNDAGIKFRYGQQAYDFNEGVLFCMAPGQVFGLTIDGETLVRPSGWALLVHPDFLWGTGLAKEISRFDFFDYDVAEALHLSEGEETVMENILRIIDRELDEHIDQFSQPIVVAQIESLLSYTDRFYQRQFVTRKAGSSRVLDQFESLLTDYFHEHLALKGIPSIQYIANELHLSPNYLSRLLSSLTGKSTKELINDRLLSVAKEKLSTTDATVNEIAWELGFEHVQSFSKFFKTKTTFSPLRFRQSFN